MNDAQPQADVCPDCKGTAGHHYMTCSTNGVGTQGERDPAETRDELPLETNEAGDLLAGGLDLSQALPPTDDDIESNRLLWLTAKVCHEANLAYCREVLNDHTHKPWAETDEALRASIYDGVVKHFENPELTPEESHRAWCEYKAAEGWVFGNMKDAVAKTHPCLLPYHQLHAHDRAKDHIFTGICNAMFGE